MTDARFPERWLNDRRIVRLSDAGFRLFVTSLAYSVANRTDGHLDKDDLELLHGVDARHVVELVEAGLMTETSSGSWLSEVFDATQSTKAQLEGLDHRRHKDRERKARQRARDRGLVDPVSRDSPADITQDIGRDTKDRPGQDRQGTYEGLNQCPHGTPNGAESDPWLKGQLTCTECRAAAQPEVRSA